MRQVRDTARPAAPNLLNRDFSAERPNAKWLADIAYIDTLEGFRYPAGVLDVFSRRVVGWAKALNYLSRLADHMREQLVA